MWLRGVGTKGKMTLERQMGVNHAGLIYHLKSFDFFLGVCVGDRLELQYSG